VTPRKRSDRAAGEPAPPRTRAVRAFQKSTLREYFESIVIAVVLALFVRTFVVQAFKIPTGSMEENLLVGDHLLVNKFVFGPTASPIERTVLPVAGIERGDVVVFKYPEDPGRDFIKRVIGLPGETLEVRNKDVYINGERLAEPYTHFLSPARGSAASPNEFTALDVRDAYGPVSIPVDQYFVMGDNRDNSQDSRYWGFLPRDYIKGRALVIYWSWDSAQGLNVLSGVRWSRLLRQIE
jgi:signal peptidase I